MDRDEHFGLVVRQKSPLNLEYQFSSLSEWVIPTEDFFVRCHFPIPDLDAANFRLRVHGAVKKELELDLPQLRAMPARTFAAVLECAGNGRVFYEPPREGLQWQSGAVGNAVWSGVPLSDVLAQAGVRDNAVEVVLIGADRGVVDGGKKTASPGPVAFARSLPLAKATSDGVLLCHTMNGAPLTVEHGFPLRAVVGGWYGMAWVKWLTAIHVITRPFNGYWETRDYVRWGRNGGEPSLVPITEAEIKSQIARPINGAVVRAGRSVRIFGAAWSGEARIEKVLVQAGGNMPFEPATLLAPDEPHAWRLFEQQWTPPAPGRYALRSRAIDAAGNVQPDTPQPDRESYLANWSVPVEVTAVADHEGGAEYVI
jgi:DMSO/TMAO reductase YedYZ molybdopterin-dependent catalytic subunit